MKILVAGDFAPVYRLAESVDAGKFQEIFPDSVCKTVKSADYALVNFESPITETGFRPITKCGPNLHCSQEAAEAVKYAGFTGVTLANNHIMDYGAEGLHKTVECCKAVGLDVVGTGENLREAARVLYLEKDGAKLAVINCCEHEFSIATDTEPGANPLNPVRQFHQIREAKANADYVLVIVHGGHEHFQLPSLRMQETYRFFIEAGADAVVNHHQHCYSGYEVYEGKPIFYGLGNFCFDDPLMKGSKTWHEGYMVIIDFCKDGINYEQVPYLQCLGDISVNPLSQTEHAAFDKHIAELNAVITDRQRLWQDNEQYYNRCVRGELTNLEPYRGRVFVKLFLLGLLPRCIKNKKLLGILNHVNCESHRDKLLYALQQQIAKH